MHQRRSPLLVVLSGPSGAGKGTALAQLQAAGFHRQPTCTTRSPRPGEVDGVDYHFVTVEDFMARRDAGGFAEYTRTYADHWYGAPSSLLSDEDPAPWIVELEPQGFHRLRGMSHRRVVGIFVVPGHPDQAVERIQARAAEDNLTSRLAVTRQQVGHAWAYDYVVVNDERHHFSSEIAAIAQAELARTAGARWLSSNWDLGDTTLTPADAPATTGPT